MSAAHNVTLSGIESTLIELYQLREDVARDPDILPVDQVASLKAIDGQIQDWIGSELEKADAIAANLHEFEMRAGTCKAEAKRQSDRATMWTARGDHLEAATLAALRLRPKDKQRIETAHTTLKIAKNPASVEVVDSAEVPKPYMRRQVTLNADLYDRLMAHLMVTKHGQPLFVELQAAKTTEPEPMKTEIAKELKAKVAVPGCRLIEDRVRLVVE